MRDAAPTPALRPLAAFYHGLGAVRLSQPAQGVAIALVLALGLLEAAFPGWFPYGDPPPGPGMGGEVGAGLAELAIVTGQAALLVGVAIDAARGRPSPVARLAGRPAVWLATAAVNGALLVVAAGAAALGAAGLAALGLPADEELKPLFGLAGLLAAVLAAPSVFALAPFFAAEGRSAGAALAAAWAGRKRYWRPVVALGAAFLPIAVITAWPVLVAGPAAEPYVSAVVNVALLVAFQHAAAYLFVRGEGA